MHNRLALTSYARQRGHHFAETSTKARQTIAELGARFIRNNAVVLTHGHSRVVLALLSRAVAQVGLGGGWAAGGSWHYSEPLPGWVWRGQAGHALPGWVCGVEEVQPGVQTVAFLF